MAIQTDIHQLAPEFDVIINGNPVSAALTRTITGISVEQRLNTPSNISFEIQDQCAGGIINWAGVELFGFGNEITVLLGYMLNKRMVFQGRIQNVSVNFSTGLSPVFSITGSDSSYDSLMESGETQAFPENRSDSQIVQIIAQNLHLIAITDETAQRSGSTVKEAGQSYFNFIEWLAARNQFEFFLVGRNLFFRRTQSNQPPRKIFCWGKNLLSFNATLNTSQKATSVTVRGWDRVNKRMIEATAHAGEEITRDSDGQSASEVIHSSGGEVNQVITDQPVTDENEALQLARARLQSSSDDFLRGTANIVGTPDLEIAQTVFLEGLGRWFSGRYYIESITHLIDTSGYRTTLGLRKNSL